MPKQATAVRTKGDVKVKVVRTFAIFYDEDGKPIKAIPLGRSLLSPQVADDRARREPPPGAQKYAIAVIKTAPKARPAIPDLKPITGRRMLQFES